MSANTTDSLRHCAKQLDIVKSSIETLQAKTKVLKAEVSSLNKTVDVQNIMIDSLKNELTSAQNAILVQADSLSANISTQIGH